MFFIRRPPALPPRNFPFVLRSEWRIDNTPKAGRLLALAFIATRPTFKRPAPFRIVAA